MCLSCFPDRREILKRSIGLTGAGLLTGFSSSMAFASENTAPENTGVPAMQPQEVTPGCWYVQGLFELGSAKNQNFISNAGFIITSEGVVIVDALGSPVLARRLLDEIASITPKKVIQVILTHYHADHIYGAQVYADMNIPIMAHQLGKNYLVSDTAAKRLQASREEMAPWIDGNTRIVEASEWIDSPRTLTFGDTTLDIMHVGPAHTAEDIAVYVREKKTLYAGDLIFRGRIPYVGNEADSGHWLASLKTLPGMDLVAIIPGHGPHSTRPYEDIQFLTHYLTHLRQVMGNAAEDMMSFEEAYAQADWSAFEHAPMFEFANRMNAYNTYISLENQLLQAQ